MVFFQNDFRQWREYRQVFCIRSTMLFENDTNPKVFPFLQRNTFMPNGRITSHLIDTQNNTDQKINHREKLFIDFFVMVLFS
jgi:hypothetical protein